MEEGPNGGWFEAKRQIAHYLVGTAKGCHRKSDSFQYPSFNVSLAQETLPSKWTQNLICQALVFSLSFILILILNNSMLSCVWKGNCPHD